MPHNNNPTRSVTIGSLQHPRWIYYDLRKYFNIHPKDLHILGEWSLTAAPNIMNILELYVTPSGPCITLVHVDTRPTEGSNRHITVDQVGSGPGFHQACEGQVEGKLIQLIPPTMTLNNPGRLWSGRAFRMTENLISSMGRRCQTIIRLRGDPTRYWATINTSLSFILVLRSLTMFLKGSYHTSLVTNACLLSLNMNESY